MGPVDRPGSSRLPGAIARKLNPSFCALRHWCLACRQAIAPQSETTGLSGALACPVYCRSPKKKGEAKIPLAPPQLNLIHLQLTLCFVSCLGILALLSTEGVHVKV